MDWAATRADRPWSPLAIHAVIMIRIKVRLYAMLRRFEPPGLGLGQGFPMELPDGSCLSDLVAALRMPAGEIKQIFVKSRRQEPDYVLADGEEVAIFPPIGGG
jgi:molybdopterin synthase sulfur carrier subunit